MPKYIIIHHSASPKTQTAEAINEYHKNKWNFKSSIGGYAGYQYIIENSGRLTQWRKDDEMGAHTIGRNHDSIGVCLVGWFDKGHDELPSQKQQEALRELLVEKMTQYAIPKENIKFHRDFASKTCPGENITKEFIFNLINMENHIVDEIISRAKKYLGIDAGSRINKAEDEKIAEKIKEVVLRKEELEKTNKLLEDVIEETRKELFKSADNLKTLQESCDVILSDKQTQINIQADILAKRAEEKEFLEKENEKLRDEITRLVSIQGRDAENTKAIDALKFFISVIFKK